MGVLAPIKPAHSETGIEVEIFTSVPAWTFVHGVRDSSCMPLFRPGEVAVVEDAPGVIPEDGGLYIIEYVSKPHWGRHLNPPPRDRRSLEIVQVNQRARRDGSTFWSCDPYARHPKGSSVIICSDGPYPDQYAIAQKLLGKVIGIYNPAAVPRGVQ